MNFKDLVQTSKINFTFVDGVEVCAAVPSSAQSYLTFWTAESVEHGPRMLEIVSLVPSRVKPMTYKNDTCHFLARHSTLLG